MMFFSKSNKQGELYRGYRTNSDLFVDWLKQRVGPPVPAIPGVKYGRIELKYMTFQKLLPSPL